MPNDSRQAAAPQRAAANDPTLKRARVQISYSSSDGHRVDFDAKGGPSTRNLRTGEEVAPEQALLSALEELARLTALFGLEQQAQEAFDAARQRVFDWRKTRHGNAAGKTR